MKCSLLSIAGQIHSTIHSRLEFIEPDQVDEQKNERLANGNEIRMGIELDKFKKPVAYHVLSYHPGDYDYSRPTGKSTKHIRIPADRKLYTCMTQTELVKLEEILGFLLLLASIKQLGALREAAIVNATNWCV